MQITKIGVLSFSKICSILCGFFGFIAGAIISFIAIIGSFAGSNFLDPGGQMMGLFSAAWQNFLLALIALPIFYGFIGFITGLLIAALYNLVSHFVGGLEIELEEMAG